MPNRFSYQVLKDDTQFAVIKLTGEFDGSGQEDNVRRIQANTLSGAMDTSKANLLSSAANTGALPYYGLSITRCWFETDTSGGDVQLYWANNISATAADGVPIFLLQGGGEYDITGSWSSMHNPTVTSNNNGDIAIRTRGQVANSSYTIVLELRKDNAHYQRGQFNDPAAFNYGSYGVRP